MARMLKAGLGLILLLQGFCITAAWSAAGPTPAFGEEVQKQKEIYDSKGARTPDGYVIDRSLLSYAHLLPAEFFKSLSKLGPQDRWLDIGAGEGRAVIDYATARYDAMRPPELRDIEGRARCVAISIEDRRNARWYNATADLEPRKIEYLHGRTFGDYSADELGQFQVITDVIGAFSYTQSITRFMEKALNMLAVNGSIYTVLQDVGWENGANKPHYPNAPFLTEIKQADGSDMKVCQWLKTISCVEVTCEAKDGFTPPIEVYQVRKTCDKVTVPDASLVHFTAGTPPERRFVLRNSPGAGVRTAGEAR
jgi:hypothetical protein